MYVYVERSSDFVHGPNCFCALNSMDYAPPFHGRFTNGRVEGFLQARALEPQDMSKRSPVDFVSLIAREMARLHGLPVTKAGPIGEAEIWQVLPRWLELAKGKWVRSICFPGCRQQSRHIYRSSLSECGTCNRRRVTFALVWEMLVDSLQVRCCE